jgi:hypothetical protein
VVQTAVLLQMRLIVLADESIADLITEVRVGYQATGILGAIGNKGGLMVRIELCHGRESMAFIATHLAAHEGEKHVRARNESLARIFAGCWEGSLVSFFFVFFWFFLVILVILVIVSVLAIILTVCFLTGSRIGRRARGHRRTHHAYRE